MVQVKKVEVERAILKSAKSLFTKKGYVNTSMAEIARQAKISTANLYIYFKSKFDIFFTLYAAWLTEYIDDLKRRVDNVDNPRQRLELILLGLWKEIPEKDNEFSNNLIQALSTVTPDEHYSRELLIESEARIDELLMECLPEDAHRYARQHLPHLLFMAMDGFVLNKHLGAKTSDVKKIVTLICDVLLVK